VRVGVVGTGTVGQAIGGRLVELGHEVVLGSRDSANPRAVDWAAGRGDRARAGTFADAAEHGEIVVNATAGVASLAALEAAGAGNLAGKVLVDVANPLDFSRGFPPTLSVSNTDSLGEQIQRAFPAARVVKALNTMNANVMVHPAAVPGDHDVFMAGDDAEAKRTVAGLLGEFGWPAESIVDVGGIAGARGLEAYILFWVTLMGAFGTPAFNVKAVRA